MTSLLALLLFRDHREETATEQLEGSAANTEQNDAEITERCTPRIDRSERARTEDGTDW